MKKLLLLFIVLFTLTFTSCNDDCTQEALSELVTSYSRSDTTEVCHNNVTITIDTSALAMHLQHGDQQGPCPTLSDGGLHFSDGEIVEIDCKYELPFIYVKENGETWLFTEISSKIF